MEDPLKINCAEGQPSLRTDCVESVGLSSLAYEIIVCTRQICLGCLKLRPQKVTLTRSVNTGNIIDNLYPRSLGLEVCGEIQRQVLTTLFRMQR